ncbi:ABC transporter ATP-binding protein [Mediterraneibacter gnavus]|mgnify:FL=1|jgi:ABC-family secretion protein|nr:ABC transporter ATP-binding protein [Mediterraneibacter gnavus]
MKTYTNLKILFPYIKKSKRYLIFGIMGILIASAIVAPVPYFIGNVLDVLVKENVTFSDIKNTLILISAIYFVKFLINMSYQQSFAKLQQKIVNEIRLDMVKSILDAPLSFINKREKGYILSRIGEVQQIGAIFSPTIITNFVGIFEMLFCFMMMMSINVKLTLVALIIVPGYFALSKSISKKITKCTVKMQEDSANLNADMFETLNGIEEVKLLNGKQIQLKKIYFKIQTLIRSAIKQSFSMIVFIQSISFVSDLVTVGILALAGIFIINGEITIGVYTAFSLYIGKLLGVTQSVGTFEITIKPVCATIERAKEFLFSDLETHKGSKKLNENIHEVFFENVSFGYKGNNIVINEMTQKFIEGDKVLLLGENGSGKTTFVKLLVGLYEPVKGKIFINNQSIDKLCKDDIRKRVGIVSQEVFLFKGSVIENILFGVEGKNRKDVSILLEKFGLTDYMERLPNGLDTQISQNGVGISGGQAQIIAFIRAVIKNKDILILDEATANLDQDTCRKIMSILCNYKLCRMLFVISHQKLDEKVFNKIIQF